MKLTKLVLRNSICFIVALTCAACFSTTKKEEYVIEDAEVPTERSYDEVSDYELVREAMFDVDSDKYYVYFYSMTCNHCEEIKNYIIEKSLERGDIYYIKGTSKDQVTNDTKKLIGAENLADFYILGYPTLALISNKKCTKNLAGIVQIKAELK